MVKYYIESDDYYFRYGIACVLDDLAKKNEAVELSVFIIKDNSSSYFSCRNCIVKKNPFLRYVGVIFTNAPSPASKSKCELCSTQFLIVNAVDPVDTFTKKIIDRLCHLASQEQGSVMTYPRNVEFNRIEMLILELYLREHTNKDIAKILNMNSKKISYYKRIIMKKCGIDNNASFYFWIRTTFAHKIRLGQ